MMECYDCRFFEAYREDYAPGLCRRNPPQLLGDATPETEHGLSGYWPEVQGDSDWCGEFSQKRLDEGGEKS
jgi:hypothetical protein